MKRRPGVLACALLIGVVLSLSQCCVAVSLAGSLSSLPSNVFGAAIAAFDTSDSMVRSFSKGFSNPTTQTPFDVDTLLRGNTMGELAVAVVVQQLITLQVLPQLDSSIPTRYLPGGIQLLNPSFPGVPLTLRMLLTHTSSLFDTATLVTSPSSSGGTNAQTDLQSYAQGYFVVQTSSGSFEVSKDIWRTVQPGLTTSFQYARANVVLLSFVLEQVIAERPSLVTSSQKTVGSLIQERVFAPLGMTDTFFLLPDASVPVVQYQLAQLTGKMAAETTSSAIVTTTVPLFAGYTADFMIRTTAADTLKLMVALFADESSTFFSVGTSLTTTMISVTDTIRPGVISQGLGVTGFSPASMCGAVTSGSGGCSVQSASVIGLASVGTKTAVSGMCVVDPSSTTSKKSCVASVQAFHPTASMTLSSTAFISNTLALNAMFIDTAVSQGATVRPSDQQPTALFGFLVFLAVVGAILMVLLLAYVGEYFLHPVPLIGAMSTNAYPTLDQHMNRSMGAMK